MFEGSFVALVTPFKDDESLDETKLKELIEFQIDGGIHGIVPCGTTGESPSLSEEEHDRVIELTVETVNSRVYRSSQEQAPIRQCGRCEQRSTQKPPVPMLRLL